MKPGFLVQPCCSRLSRWHATGDDRFQPPPRPPSVRRGSPYPPNPSRRIFLPWADVNVAIGIVPERFDVLALTARREVQYSLGELPCDSR